MRPGSRRRTGDGAASAAVGASMPPPPPPSPAARRLEAGPAAAAVVVARPEQCRASRSSRRPAGSPRRARSRPRKWTTSVSRIATTSRLTLRSLAAAATAVAPRVSQPAARRAASCCLDLQQRQDGLGGVAARVALAAAGARQRLVEVVDRQHAERARHAGRQLHVLDAARATRRRRSRSAWSRRGSRRRGRRRRRSGPTRRRTWRPAAARRRRAREHVDVGHPGLVQHAARAGDSRSARSS